MRKDLHGKPATEAQLTFPYGVATDVDGNFYIADTENHRIRKVDAQGIITTFAGTGEEGYGGDDGPATEAELDWPTGVAVDGAGNVYIADRNNERVRRVDPAGIITTFAGNGEWGYDSDEDGGPATSALLNWPTGVAVDADGNLYIADEYNNRIRKVDTSGIITTVAGMRRLPGEVGEEEEDDEDVGEPATSALLNRPTGVAVDTEGNLYVADRNNHRIRKVDAEGVITTIAGMADEGFSGDGGPAASAQLNKPSGIAIDEDGYVFIADRDNNRIRQIDPDGMISTFIGAKDGSGESGTEGRLAAPRGVAVDAEGNVYISDKFNNRVRKIDADGIITTFAGSGEKGPFEDEDAIGDGGPAIDARLRGPTGLAFDAEGNLYITDPGNHRIRKVDAQGMITTIAGSGERSFSGDEGPAAEAQFSLPVGFEIDVDGNIYIADYAYPRNRIRKIDTAGIITTIAETASLGGVTVDADGNVYVVESSVGRVLKLSPSGVLSIIAGSAHVGYGGDGGPATLAQLDVPKGIEVDADGNVYVVDSENNRVRKLTPNR